jgi:hypothetical protein
MSQFSKCRTPLVLVLVLEKPRETTDEREDNHEHEASRPFSKHAIKQEPAGRTPARLPVQHQCVTRFPSVHEIGSVP